MQQVERRRPQTLLCLQGVTSWCGGSHPKAKFSDRMVPLTRDGGARETGHVLPSRNGLSARDLTVISQGTYSTRDSFSILTHLPKSPFHMIDLAVKVARGSCILDTMVSTGQPLVRQSGSLGAVYFRDLSPDLP